MRMRTFSAALGVAAVALTGVTVVASPAAATCYGSNCDGKDPGVYCTDGRIVASAWAGSAYVELRYSPTCRSAWARISRATWQTVNSAPYARIYRNSDGLRYRNAGHCSGLQAGVKVRAGRAAKARAVP